MSEINQIELHETLQRIKTALNKRYEKDAEMYISYQDALGIKHHLYDNELTALTDMTRSGIISNTLLARVVAKNLWLINDFSKGNIKQIDAILANCDFKTLQNIKTGADNNTVEIPSELKKIILKYYYTNADSNICMEYLDNATQKPNYDNDILRVCFCSLVERQSTVQDKCKIIDEYIDKFKILSDDSKLLIELAENMDEDEKKEFSHYITNYISANLSVVKQLIPFRNALYRLPNWTHNSILVLQSFSRDTGKFKLACKMVRNLISKIKDEEDIKNAVISYINMFNNSNEDMKACMNKFIFGYAYYNEKVKNVINELATPGINKPANNELDERGTLSSKTAEGIFEFLENNDGSGPLWCNWFVSNTFFKIKGKKCGDVIVNFIQKYSDSEYANKFPSIFAKFAERVSSDSKINVPLECLLKFFMEDKNTSPNNYDACENMARIEEKVVNALIRKNCKCGGKDSAFYKYLYDNRREDCIRIFDL